jgi:hypothetical protein
VPPRIRWLLVHTSAAAAGAWFGWVQFSTRTAAWIGEHGWHNAHSWVWAGIGVGFECLRANYSRHRLVIRWLTAIPISSIVLGTLLYGTGWQNLELPW